MSVMDHLRRPRPPLALLCVMEPYRRVMGGFDKWGQKMPPVPSEQGLGSQETGLKS